MLKHLQHKSLKDRADPDPLSSHLVKYSDMHMQTLKLFAKRQREQKNSMMGRLLSLEFTCKMCKRLGYFTDNYTGDPQTRQACPRANDFNNRQFANGVMASETDIHALRVCCAAFGVGHWDTYKAVCPLLRDYDISALEFQTHIELGVWDITPFIGIHVWPPTVKIQLAKLHAKSLQLDDTVLKLMNYRSDDPLSRLFINPVRFRVEWDPGFYHDDHQQRLWMANFVEFSVDSIDIARAQEELDVNPFGEYLEQLYGAELNDSVTDFLKQPSTEPNDINSHDLSKIIKELQQMPAAQKELHQGELDIQEAQLKTALYKSAQTSGRSHHRDEVNRDEEDVPADLGTLQNKLDSLKSKKDWLNTQLGKFQTLAVVLRVENDIQDALDKIHEAKKKLNKQIGECRSLMKHLTAFGLSVTMSRQRSRELIVHEDQQEPQQNEEPLYPTIIHAPNRPSPV